MYDSMRIKQEQLCGEPLFVKAWHECTTCGCGGGAGTSVPLVGVGGGGLARVYHLYVGIALSQHCFTSIVGTVSLVSLSRCSGLGLRFPVPGSPGTGRRLS